MSIKKIITVADARADNLRQKNPPAMLRRIAREDAAEEARQQKAIRTAAYLLQHPEVGVLNRDGRVVCYTFAPEYVEFSII